MRKLCILLIFLFLISGFRLHDKSHLTGANLADNDAVFVEDYSDANDTKHTTMTDIASYMHADNVTSDIQAQLDARCLESVFGTSIGTGLLLDGTALKTSTILQKYHGVDPSADVLTMLGSANNTAIKANIEASPPATKTICSSTTDININQCHYVCDGTADNVQIQAAIDAIFAGSATGATMGGAGGKGSILLTEGTYQISSPVEMKPGIILFSNALSSGCVINAGVNLNNNLFQFTENSVDPSAGFMFKNIHFSGNRANQSANGTAIDTKTGTYALWDLQIKDCLFYDFKSTALIIDDPWGFRFLNSQIEDSDSYAIEINKGTSKTEGAIINSSKIIQCGKGIRLNNVDGSVIVGNEINTTGAGEYAIDIISSTGSNGHGNIIVANKLWGGTNGICIGTNALSNNIAHNTIVSMSGTELTDNGTNTVIQGNRGDDAETCTNQIPNKSVSLDDADFNKGVRLSTTTSKPTCNVAHRGTLWTVQGGAGVKDAVEVCAKDGADSYAWRTIY